MSDNTWIMNKTEKKVMLSLYKMIAERYLMEKQIEDLEAKLFSRTVEKDEASE